jgi:hypothetical protein
MGNAHVRRAAFVARDRLAPRSEVALDEGDAVLLQLRQHGLVQVGRGGHGDARNGVAACAEPLNRNARVSRAQRTAAEAAPSRIIWALMATGKPTVRAMAE